MILRRITSHVRDQNWTAIGIDFLIVVVGVFLGIQIGNWNDDRADRQRGQDYLERIVADLDADLRGYEQNIQFWTVVRDYGLVATTYADTGDAGNKTHWQLLLAYFQASQAAEFYSTDTTYEELKSAGELGLIDDVALRDQLASYYRGSDNPILSERTRYREHVRGTIPTDIQSYIWENCFGVTLSGEQRVLDCDTPVDEGRARQIVDRIVRDEQLIEDLRYSMSTLEVATWAAELGIDQARDLRAVVVEQMDRPAP
ncbi:hypothetical protein ACRAQ6_02965 [Erythrobacter sp. HA6-11]